jgi:hypothetical protein
MSILAQVSVYAGVAAFIVLQSRPGRGLIRSERARLAVGAGILAWLFAWGVGGRV